jgi:Raf kinase inhibitor-like YbhB/YbcL family protein
MLKQEAEKQQTFSIESPAFNNGGLIPAVYTCDGKNINPPLTILNTPPQTKSLALIVDDPDAPVGLWIHWVAWNINPETKKIPEGIQKIGTNGKNTRGKNEYGGPCPPDKMHRYFFKIFALDTVLNISENNGNNELLEAIKDHVIARAELIGLYNRKS